MTRVVVHAPLDGWCLPLAQVPDEVFAQGMAGDGVAIDPTSGVVRAPFDGEIVTMPNAKHAVTVRAGGVDILVHVGIDTVQLGGAGFELPVAAGGPVRVGDPILVFDLDAVARRARSAVTPILLAGAGTIARRAGEGLVKAGDILMEVEAGDVGVAAAAAGAGQARIRLTVPFDHGLHVRPAALIAAALRPFAAQVTIAARGRRANARSTVALMSLGVHCGETIEVDALGADANAAIAALERLLAPEVSVRVPKEAPRPRPSATGARRIEGLVASRGVAMGVAAPWSQPEIAVAETGASQGAEQEALAKALAFVRDHLAALSRSAAGEQQELLNAHAELVQDPELEREAREWLARGKSAAYAWRQATRSMMEALSTLDDARMRERAADLRDLENQVVRVLHGETPSFARSLPEQAIVLADDLLPSQLMALDAARIAGLCLERGGATSHVAIIAAARGIPTLVAAGPAILEVAEGTPVVLDAEHGWLDVDPPAGELQAAQRAAVQRAAERSADLEAAHAPCETLDGVRILVKANVGSIAEARAAMANGAEGCGLLRTEFLFLDLPLPREDNPALGLRGIRTSLWRPDLLRTQLAAIMRAAPRGQHRILLPMVNDVEELESVRALAAECAREIGVASVPAIGVMIETPAAAILAEQLAARADFLSLGTNDLAQYALAIDRGHPELTRRLDALHPAVLRLIAVVADAGREAGKSVSVCGAMGSDVDALPILIGLGVSEVSATPAMIPRLKRTVRLLDAGECRELAHRALEQQSAAAVRDLALYARGRARAAAQTAGDLR